MGSTPISTYSGTRLQPLYRPDKQIEQHVALKASLTYAAGTVLGEVTATPGTYGPYASGNVDGTQNARALLQYGCTTDASGNISMGGDWALTYKTAPVFVGGGSVFRTQDVVGLDAGGLTALGGVLIEGNFTTGEFRF